MSVSLSSLAARRSAPTAAAPFAAHWPNLSGPAEPRRETGAAWRARAAKAEWNLPDGRVAGVIVQLRRRGQVAYLRSHWVLAVLILTVLAGLAWFIGRPLAEIWADGREGAWREVIRQLDADDSRLDGERDRLLPGLKADLSLLPEALGGFTPGGEGLNALLTPDGSRTVVVAGDGGTIFLAPLPAAQAFATFTPAPGAAGDAAIADAVAALHAALRHAAFLPPFEEDLRRIGSLRKAIATQKANAGNAILALDAAWWRPGMVVEVQDKDGKVTSRTREKPDALTALAQNAPPGILLLFLLATLSGLYRYTIKLAGFHHGRADALELIVAEEAPDAARFQSYAATLGADGVEFKEGKPPTEAAGDMAAALIQRFGPK